MSWFTTALTSSLGRKFVMAFTGLFLVSFLMVHLGGNLLLLDADPGPFNAFALFMGTNPIIKIMEVGLFAGFFLHIWQGILLAQKNRAARGGQNYYQEKQSGTWLSRNAIYTGLILLIFLLIHIYQFWIRSKFVLHTHDLYALTLEVFKQPLITVFYIISFILLGLHLNHGFQSAFQSIGINHPKYTPAIKGLGTIIAFIFPLGFTVIAVVVTMRALGMI